MIAVKTLLALLFFLAAAVPAMAAEDITAAGAPAIGSSIIATIRAQGTPTSVASSDIGHLWTWEKNGETLRAITDDNGTVRMFDLRKDGAGIEVASQPPFHITLARTPQLAVDNGLHSYADYTMPGWLPDRSAKAQVSSFRTSASRELVLFFDQDGKAAKELVYGERGMVARAGLLPGAVDSTQTLVYRAPVLKHAGVVPYPRDAGSGTTILKLSVDKTGSVDDVTLFVSSGDAALDDAAKKAAMKDSYAPAQLAGKSVSAIVFRDERFTVQAR